MDTDGQLTFEDDDGTIRYKQGFQFIIRRDFPKALEIFRSLKERNYNVEIGSIVRIVEFWNNSFSRVLTAKDDEEKVTLLKRAWLDFEEFYRRNGFQMLELNEQMKRVVFSYIRDLYISRFQKLDVPNIDMLIDLGRIFLDLKEIDKAEETLSYALKLSPANVEVISHLSDVYFFKNDLNRSKAYLRQAFLLNAEKVPVEDLRSPIIRDIKLTTEQEGYRNDIKQWMPVCATYMNIFDVKRELTQDEIDEIEDDCRNLEDQADQDKSLRETIRPALIYKYLILLDHMLVAGRIHDPRLIMYEMRLKNLDEDVQRKYFEKVFNHGD